MRYIWVFCSNAERAGAAPDDLVVPYVWVGVRKERAYIAAHPLLNLGGTLDGPFGKVGADVLLAAA